MIVGSVACMDFKTTDKLGKVLKSHGKEGDLIVGCDRKFQETFLNEKTIFLEIDGGMVPFSIQQAELKSSHSAILKLTDVDSIEQANELVDHDWFLPAGNEKTSLNIEPESFSSLRGYLMTDQNDRKIGKIEDVQEIPSNTILQVRQGNRLIDIPVNEDTIYKINKKNKTVKNHIPEGLLDL